MGKKIIRLTESELTSLIKHIVAESQHLEDRYDGELEEGWFGPSDEEIEERKIELIRNIDDLLENEGLTDDDLRNSVESVLRKAQGNHYDGEVEIRTSSKGEPMLIYRENPSKLEKSWLYKNVMEPAVGGLRSGHTFGGGRKK